MHNIGIVPWFSNNFGSELTNMSLYNFLSENNNVYFLNDKGHIDPYINKKLINKKIKIDNYNNLSIDTLCIGSDFTWGFGVPWYDKNKINDFTLSFSNKEKKISIAPCLYPSNNEYENKIIKNNLSKFDLLTLRERFNKDILNTYFNKIPEVVLDPIFLSKLNFKKQQPNNKYILAYILMPTKEKRDFLLQLKEKTKLNLKIILNRDELCYLGCKNIFNMDKYIVNNTETDIDTFLNHFYFSDIIVTDSYHGLCCSIIFNKQYICINDVKANNRIKTIKEIFNLSNIYNSTESFIFNEINYKHINIKLENEIRQTKEILNKYIS